MNSTVPSGWGTAVPPTTLVTGTTVSGPEAGERSLSGTVTLTARPGPVEARSGSAVGAAGSIVTVTWAVAVSPEGSRTVQGKVTAPVMPAPGVATSVTVSVPPVSGLATATGMAGVPVARPPIAVPVVSGPGEPSARRASS